MSRIRIKNFGPIKEGNVENDGWIDIKKVTVFIGDQGSGKSTVAKLISTFTWLEKALVRGDYTTDYFEDRSNSFVRLLEYHRLENYSKEVIKNVQLEYHGDAFMIFWDGYFLKILNKDIDRATNYSLPQIMYVPAERNFLSYVRSPSELKLSSDSLKEFLAEYDNAKETIEEPLQLPIGNVELEYNRLQEVLYLKGVDYKIRLTDASSGYQSLVPLFLVSEYLADNVVIDAWAKSESMTVEEKKRFQRATKQIYSNDSLTNDQKRAAISALASKFNKTSFINIVEEPEQNLYPTSQREMLNSLLEFNNMSKGNKLIMTTHSPYIINYLSIAVQAAHTKELELSAAQLNRLDGIVPLVSLVESTDLAIYQLHENGTLSELSDYEGIPSDDNLLNESLAHGNELFDSLLELEQEL